MQSDVVIGMDWADAEHVTCLLFDGGKEIGSVMQTPEAVDEWVASLQARFRDRNIFVCLEQSRGGLIYALMKYRFIHLVPVNPKQLSRFRDAMVTSGAKNDPGDAALLAELFAKHRDRLRVWNPDTEETRLLALLNEDRRGLVDNRTALSNQLKSLLKQYFPQAFDLVSSIRSDLACDLLERWPSFQDIQQADRDEVREVYQLHRCRRKKIEERIQVLSDGTPLTDDGAILNSRKLLVRIVARQIRCLNAAIDEYDQKIAKVFGSHEDHEIFTALPGAGKSMASRLCAAFGTNRGRYNNAAEMQSASGIAPVTKASGKSLVVHRRWACNTFLRQTFHEYAAHSIRRSAWAKAYYRKMKDKTGGHHAAVRALAFKWIRIIYRCWKDRTIYDEVKYCAALQRRGSDLFNLLATEKEQLRK